MCIGIHAYMLVLNCIYAYWEPEAACLLYCSPNCDGQQGHIKLPSSYCHGKLVSIGDSKISRSIVTSKSFVWFAWTDPALHLYQGK